MFHQMSDSVLSWEVLCWLDTDIFVTNFGLFPEFSQFSQIFHVKVVVWL